MRAGGGRFIPSPRLNVEELFISRVPEKVAKGERDREKQQSSLHLRPPPPALKHICKKAVTLLVPIWKARSIFFSSKSKQPPPPPTPPPAWSQKAHCCTGCKKRLPLHRSMETCACKRKQQQATAAARRPAQTRALTGASRGRGRGPLDSAPPRGRRLERVRPAPPPAGRG